MGWKSILLIPLLFMIGCTKEYSPDEYISVYNSQCKTELKQGNTRFFAMPMSEDYEIAKWGSILDSGMRVLLWVTPKSEISFEQVYLEKKENRYNVISMSKMKSFELDGSDTFILAFAEEIDSPVLHIKGISNGIGNVALNLKDCNKIRLVGKK